MKKSTRPTAAPRTFRPFQKGQVWRIADLKLAITSVGKNLVHYKRYRTQPKGVYTTRSSKPLLRKYLMSVGAVLIAE